MIETFSGPIPPDIHALAEDLMGRLSDRHLMISVAESCTGGLLAAVLTDVEGNAHAFDRGFVTYTDEAKCAVLGVSPTLIAECTAVSRRVAHEMVVGALTLSQADIALSVTGYAGPGAPGEEPGLMYFGIGRSGGPVRVIKRRFGQVSRAAARIEALRTALGELLLEAGHAEPVAAERPG